MCTHILGDGAREVALDDLHHAQDARARALGAGVRALEARVRGLVVHGPSLPLYTPHHLMVRHYMILCAIIRIAAPDFCILGSPRCLARRVAGVGATSAVASTPLDCKGSSSSTSTYLGARDFSAHRYYSIFSDAHPFFKCF